MEKLILIIWYIIAKIDKWVQKDFIILIMQWLLSKRTLEKEKKIKMSLNHIWKEINKKKSIQYYIKSIQILSYKCNLINWIL